MSRRVVVIIPTYNGTRWLERCLSSLRTTDYEPMSVEVIDNASTDGSAELVEEKYEPVSVLRLDENVGFARAVNLGVHRALEADAEFVVLLNQDTWVRPDWLKMLMKGAESADLGVASPMQLNYEGSAVEGEFAKLLNWHGYDVEKPDGPVLTTQWVIGAAMMVRADLFRTIGNLDENYFFYGEELDFCRRALVAGFKIGVVTGAEICHRERAAGEEGVGRSYHRLLGDYVYGLKSPARPLFWLTGKWVCRFAGDLWRGIVKRRRRFLFNLFAVQWTLLKKLPAICRRRRQERRCPHVLW